METMGTQVEPEQQPLEHDVASHPPDGGGGGGATAVVVVCDRDVVVMGALVTEVLVSGVTEVVDKSVVLVTERLVDCVSDVEVYSLKRERRVDKGLTREELTVMLTGQM